VSLAAIAAYLRLPGRLGMGTALNRPSSPLVTDVCDSLGDQLTLWRPSAAATLRLVLPVRRRHRRTHAVAAAARTPSSVATARRRSTPLSDVAA